VNESPLGVEQIELAVETRPSSSDGGSVGKHTERSGDLGQISSGNVGGGLVTDTELEAGRAPVDELNGTLGLDLSDGRVDVFGNDISSVEKSASHVFTLTRIAFNHLVVRFEARVSKLRDSVGLVGSLAGRDDRSVGGEGEVDTRERNQVDLELVQVDVEGTVESKGSGDRGDDLSDDSVQVFEPGRLNSQVLAADVVDSLVINHERTVDVLESGVGGEDRVVGFDDGRREGRSRVNRELELGLLSVVDG